jgi:hypothetical protein
MHILRFGLDAELPESVKGSRFEWIEKSSDPFGSRTDTGLAEDWEIVRDEILAEWLDEAPGTRPAGWWLFAAPRWRPPYPDRCGTRLEWYLQKIAEPRRRLGGIGTPDFEVLNVWPHFSFGLPTGWVSDFQEQYYNGAAVDIDGRPIGTEFTPGQFAGLAPRVENPPTFESQAAYLDRHGLLTPGERRRLPADAFAPEAIAIPHDADIDVRAEFPGVFDGPIWDETRTDDER